MRKEVEKQLNEGFIRLHAVENEAILYLMQSAGFSVDAAQTQLEKVLASPGFARNERMSRFLRFLVERHLKGQDKNVLELAAAGRAVVLALQMAPAINSAIANMVEKMIRSSMIKVFRDVPLPLALLIKCSFTECGRRNHRPGDTPEKRCPWASSGVSVGCGECVSSGGQGAGTDCRFPQVAATRR